jgi:hypothetical protein
MWMVADEVDGRSWCATVMNTGTELLRAVHDHLSERSIGSSVSTSAS